MFEASVFNSEKPSLDLSFQAPLSKDYKVYLNGKEIPVYTCRISRYPFNTWWPGHQRQIEQSEKVSYINVVSDEDIEIAVEPLAKENFKKILLKPYSKGVKPQLIGNKIVFKLKENGGYVLELDDYHGLLYIFNNKPIEAPKPEEVTYYFGKGIHFPGRITLKSNQSIYVDKDALVYGCIFAEKAENIRIFGNGVFDDSTEERALEHCYKSTPNGNIKFYDCKNITINGVGFTNSAIWCVNIFHCFDVLIDGINVFGQWRYNTDGIDIVNSQRVTVKNSFVHSFDDSITVKGIDEYAYENNIDILAENCVLWCDWGKTCEIGFETACKEYRNITFRNCDLLRAGGTACDINNGNFAEVHNVTFENIRIEIESFYTPPLLQQSDEQQYDRQDENHISFVAKIANHRIGDFYDSLKENDIHKKQIDKERYASVHDIKIKDINIYCDLELVAKEGTKCAKIALEKIVTDSKFENIVFENIYLNGVKLLREEMDITLKNCTENNFKVI